MEPRANQTTAGNRGNGTGDTVRPRRVPAYFTLYLLSELLSSLRPRQKP